MSYRCGIGIRGIAVGQSAGQSRHPLPPLSSPIVLCDGGCGAWVEVIGRGVGGCCSPGWLANGKPPPAWKQGGKCECDKATGRRTDWCPECWPIEVARRARDVVARRAAP